MSQSSGSVPRHGGGALAYGLLCATVCTLVLATHAHTTFERVRYRVVTSAQVAATGTLEIPLPDLTPLAGRAAAVVVRVRGASEPARLSIALNRGSAFRTVMLPPGRSMRVDASIDPPPGSGHVLTLESDSSGFVLEYVEVANVHGFTRGPVGLLILPRQNVPDPPIPLWVAAIVWLSLAPVRPWRRPVRPWIRRLQATTSASVLAFFAIVLLSGAFSPYRISISLAGLALLTAALYADPLARVAGWLRTTRLAVPASWRYATHAAVVAIFAVSVAQFYRPDTGFTTFIQFGEQFQVRAIGAVRSVPRAVDSKYGYDGQFYAQLSLDPLLRRQETKRALDSPGYRARRILLPWIASVAGVWGAWWALQAYAVVNIVAWGLLAWLLLRWCPPTSARATAAWVACMFSQGLITSVTMAVADGPSLLFIAASVRAVELARHRLATGTLAISGLVRETNLLSAVVLLPPRLRTADWRVVAGRLVVVAIPLSLWLFYLWWIGISPLGAGARNFGVPLAGYVAKAAATMSELAASGWGSFARVSLLAQVALTTQAVVLLSLRQRDSHWWRIGIAYFVLMLCLGPAVWEGYPGAVIRVVLPMTVAFNLLLVRVRPFWPLWVLGNANLVFGFTAIRADNVLPMLRWMQLI